MMRIIQAAAVAWLSQMHRESATHQDVQQALVLL